MELIHAMLYLNGVERMTDATKHTYIGNETMARSVKNVKVTVDTRECHIGGLLLNIRLQDSDFNYIGDVEGFLDITEADDAVKEWFRQWKQFRDVQDSAS